MADFKPKLLREPPLASFAAPCRQRRFGVLRIAIALALSASLAGCMADLRPDSAFVACPSHVERGKALLKRMAEAHGGIAAFAAFEKAQATFTNDWPGMLALVRPWPSDVEHLSLEFGLGHPDGVISFVDGEAAGTEWIRQKGVSYKKEPGAEKTAVDDDNIQFWVPTLGYFLQAPFRLHEAQTVYFQEQREVDGRRYDLVFASWGGAAPHAKADQYLAWIDAETHQLARLEFTVREMGGFVTGRMDYRDYARVDGMLFPFLVIGTDDLGGEQTAHAIRVSSLQLQ